MYIYACKRCGTEHKTNDHVDAVYCTCAWRTIEACLVREETFADKLADCTTGEDVIDLCDETVMTKEWCGLAKQRLYELCPDYTAEIASWDWEGIKADCAANGGACYLGSVLSLYPSGKYYTFWTTNQTLWDTIRDEAFQETLDIIASTHGLWVDNSGEGDACDVLAYEETYESDY